MGPVATVRHSLTFAGRARRSELLTYLLASVLVSLPVSFVSGLVLPYEQHLLATNVLALLLALPIPALLARRIHDAGWSGRWTLLALPGFALWLARAGVSALWGIDARLNFDRWTGLVDWLVILANIACVILVLLPGSAGTNRFGESPHEAGPAD